MREAGHGNIEIVHKLNETAERVQQHGSRFEEAIEIVEAVVLALVAVATAWSGYQAARWDSHRAKLYGETSKLRITAEGLATLGGQELIYDTTTFNAWLNVKSHGDEKPAQLLERRFRDEYRLAFTAWMKTDPLNNSQSPPGPIFMPEYHNAKSEQAAKLSSEASAVFDQGTKAGTTGDDYVRITVLLATVLLLTAISQRFRITSVRTGLLAVAFVLLGICVWSILTLPRT